MKRLSTTNPLTQLTAQKLTALLAAVLLFFSPAARASDVTLEVIERAPQPIITKGSPGTDDNRSGFETGVTLKLGDTYHMFISEMWGRHHLDMRVAHWTSADSVRWTRRSTVRDSVPGRSPDNPRSEVWAAAVAYDELGESWNLFYLAYRGGGAGEVANLDYAGRIWRAVSRVKGRNGIDGPYEDAGVVLAPDANAQVWEGQQAINGFYPYRVDNNWYALYGGRSHLPPSPWLVGLAISDKLTGPYRRVPERSPAGMETLFAENPVVTRLHDGTYIAVYDVGLYPGEGPYRTDNAVAYSISEDGVRWRQGKPLVVQSDGAGNWAADVRTPLGLMPEPDGTYTLLYTAREKDKEFWGIGRVKVRVIKR